MPFLLFSMIVMQGLQELRQEDGEDGRGLITSGGMEVGRCQPKIRTRRSTCFHKIVVVDYMMAKKYHR